MTSPAGWFPNKHWWPCIALILRRFDLCACSQFTLNCKIKLSTELLKRRRDKSFKSLEFAMLSGSLFKVEGAENTIKIFLSLENFRQSKGIWDIQKIWYLKLVFRKATAIHFVFDIKYICIHKSIIYHNIT